MNKQEIKQALQFTDHKLSELNHRGLLFKIYSTIRIALQQQLNNGWISVSERLPEINVSVLVCYECGGTDVMKYFNYFGNMTFGREELNGYHITDEIVAWQPLPEPYKEASNETNKEA